MQRLAYIFGPLGWSHDGGRATTAQLRALAARLPAIPGASGQQESAFNQSQPSGRLIFTPSL